MPSWKGADMIKRIFINRIPIYKGICDGCMRWMPGQGEEPDEILNAMKKNGWKVTPEGEHYCDECKRTIQPAGHRSAGTE